MRRATLLLLGAGLVLLLWAAAPALSVRAYAPRAQDFEMAVPSGGVAGAARAPAKRPVITRVLRAPRRFDLLGLRWRRPVAPEIHVRVRRDGGRWSRWVRAPAAEDHGPDGERPLRGSDPVWAGGADELQLRLRGPVRGLRIHFVNTTGTATAADRARTALRRGVHAAFAAVATPLARAAGVPGPQPDIVTRDAWGADQCPPRAAPGYGTVDLALVHHTVSANEYTAADSAAIVLAICRYHRNSNKWNDIGYNFLVDRFGTIFEGREGGAEAAVIGAQAQGYNSVSTGVAVIGTHDNDPATGPTMAALTKLLAWKLPFHGTPTTGQVIVKSGGGSLNRYPSGHEVTFERIAGHRDGDSTACPGAALYQQLPGLRSMVAASVIPAPVLTMAAARTELDYPGTAELSGRLTLPDGSAVGGAPVEIQLLGSKGFRKVRTVTTGADGVWSASIETKLSRVFRAVAPGTDARAAGRSVQVPVSVTPVLRARLAAKRVTVGRSAVVTGSLRPHKRALTLIVDRQRGAGGIFARARSLKVRATAGRFRVALRLTRLGLHRLQIRFAGDEENAPARSQQLLVRAVRG